jgi:glycosyltransferase XagB
VPADEESAYRRLSEEAGLRFLALDGSPAGGAVDRAAARLLPAELSRRLGAIAVHADAECVTVATSRADDALVVRAVRALTGRRAEVVISPPSRIARAQRHAFGARLRTRARRASRGRELIPDEEAAALALAGELSLPYVGPGVEATAEALDVLPRRLCRRHQVLPLAISDGTLAVAMAEPQDAEARGAVAAVAGGPLRILVASAPTVRAGLDALYCERDLDDAVHLLARRRPEQSASYVLSRAQRVVLWAGLALLAAGIAVAPLRTLTVLTAAAIAFYAISSIHRFALIFRALGAAYELRIAPEETARLEDRRLPVYTILVPLRAEGAVLADLLDALASLDYPAHKLDVKLLLEEDDDDTLAALEGIALPPYVHVCVTPDVVPRTKPRACNVGLLRARGDYVVIYDAEDRPDPGQLKQVVAAFRRVPRDVACVQAKLGYWNRDQNVLTRWFAAEYAQLFDLLLPALEAARGPLPLGGTSNHFRIDALLQLDGWDPFNVTEDADLGMRLARAGYRTAVVESTTYEEANSQLRNWVRQRSRWIKGYLQTWLIHMRHPVVLWRDLGTARWLSFQLVIGGTALVPLLNPCFWLLTLLWVLTQAHAIQEVFPGVIYLIGGFQLLVANFLFAYANVAGVLRRGYYSLAKYALLSPLYWGLMSVGAWRGLIQLITRPHYWEKTVHGLAPQVHAPDPAPVPAPAAPPAVAHAGAGA